MHTEVELIAQSYPSQKDTKTSYMLHLGQCEFLLRSLQPPNSQRQYEEHFVNVFIGYTPGNNIELLTLSVRLLAQ